MNGILDWFNNLNTSIPGLSGGVGNFLTGLLLLIVFWIIGNIVSRILRGLLNRGNVDGLLQKNVGDIGFSLSNILPTIAKWFIILFGIVAFLQRINLPMVSEPINGLLNQITGFVPSIFGALILGAIAFVLATVVKTVVTKGAESLNLEGRVNSLGSKVEDVVDGDGYDTSVSSTEVQESSIAPALGTGLFWLVILMFLPSILDKLGMSSLVEPLNGMLSQMTGFLPNILSAVIIGGIGYIVAKILRQVLEGLLGATPIDGFGKRAGLDMSISSLVGQLVFAVVMLLVIVQALDALRMPAISGPATSMVDQIFAVAPKLVGATLVLGISYYVGKIIAGLVQGLLEGSGFDSMPQKMGLNLNSSRSLSSWAGLAIMVAIMAVAATAAVGMLGIDSLTDITGTLVGLGGNVLFGAILLGAGLWLANMAYNFATEAGISKLWAQLIRAAIMVLVAAMALNAIGIGESIVELAFGIGLGAIGIAAALAFGLGSRDIAGRQMEKFVSEINDN